MTRFLKGPIFWPLAALAALTLFNVVFTRNFAVIEIKDGRLFGTVVDILRNGAPVVLLAVGMVLVIATAGIDLSVGSVMALSGTVAGLLIVNGRQPLPAAIAGGLAAGAAVGACNGALVTFGRIQPIVVTLISLVAGRGLAQALNNDQKVRLNSPAFEFIGNGGFLGLPLPIFIAGGVAALVLLAMRKTVLGLYVEAIGGNPRTARLCGMPVHGVRMFVYTFSAFCAGIAGLIATAQIGVADVANCGLYLELDAILAVVIGGTSLAGGRPNVAGAVIGALIIQMLTTMLQMKGVRTEYTLIVKAVVAVAVCFVQTPLFGRLLSGLRRRESPA